MMVRIAIIVGSTRPGRMGIAVVDRHFAEVPKQTDQIGVADAELPAAPGPRAH